ncbi:unnamed protein product [Rhizopus stolonifer]
MVSVILSNTKPFNSKFKFGVEYKERQASTNIKDGEVAVKIKAAAFNHRDVWILKDEYAGASTGSLLGSDGVGHITRNGSVGQRVLLNPGHNWDKDEQGPEREFGILGLAPLVGTFTNEEVIVKEEDTVPCPEFLSNTEAAALPLAGLTAYRVVFTKCKVQKGQHVLITGIGGGVALYALQFAVAAGANVYVTSSSSEKIQKSIELGAKGGINYKDEDCIDQLQKLLGNNKLSSIIDGAGGPLYEQYPRVLRSGGTIACYGYTASLSTGLNLPISYVIENINVKGSTMGSRDEFVKMVKFVDERKIKPIVSQVWNGLNKDTFEEAVKAMA